MIHTSPGVAIAAGICVVLLGLVIAVFGAWLSWDLYTSARQEQAIRASYTRQDAAYTPVPVWDTRPVLPAAYGPPFGFDADQHTRLRHRPQHLHQPDTDPTDDKRRRRLALFATGRVEPDGTREMEAVR